VGLCANVIAVLVISQLAGNVTDITYHLSKYRRTRRGTFSSAILPPLDSLLFSHISGDRRRSRVQQTCGPFAFSTRCPPPPRHTTTSYRPLASPRPPPRLPAAASIKRLHLMKRGERDQSMGTWRSRSRTWWMRRSHACRRGEDARPAPGGGAVPPCLARASIRPLPPPASEAAGAGGGISR
jgi:hypothetical protein